MSRVGGYDPTSGRVTAGASAIATRAQGSFDEISVMILMSAPQRLCFVSGSLEIRTYVLY
jgi:phosphopantetheine adenylyltransferase